jgi:four helix bundle protein
MQNFRQLRVWRKASGLAVNLRRAADSFPKSGYADLKAQMISAAESILFNIIEGCGAPSQKDFARLLSIGIKSSMELEGQLDQARRYEILGHAEWTHLSEEVIDVRRMLHGLRKKVLVVDLSGSCSHAITHDAQRETHGVAVETVTAAPVSGNPAKSTTGDAEASPADSINRPSA